MWEKISKVAESLQNSFLAFGVVLAAIYIVFPDFRRWVEVNITERSAHFYLGKVCNNENQIQRWTVAESSLG